ncbi:glycosyltransferase family 2 protein [Candidatus Woesearchaeota archaeon]|nr:glycosyltransferase family 2 protein [Candidatus Woesearchaeota archaeon]
MKVVVAIPAFNEERTIGRVIDEISGALHDYTHKILVVDDGSNDKTVAIASKHGAKVVSNKKNMGLAYTFKKEMKECLAMKADVIVHTDADGQYPASFIPQLLERIEMGDDIVLGSRFEQGLYSGSISKRLGNIAFAKVFSQLLKTRITDTTTGFRAFTKEVAKLPLINDFTYTQEQLIRAGRNNMRISEIPIATRKTRPSRLFSNPFDYAFKAWVNIFRIYRDFAPLMFFGMMGVVLMGLGGLIAIYFVYLHLTSGIQGHLGLLFMMMLLIVTGLQVILFGFLADMHRQ